MTPPSPFLARVYYVTSPNDDTVRLAMDIGIKDGMLCWFDTVKERRMKIGKIVEHTLTRFVFARADGEPGREYTFVPLTLEIFRAHVKDHILIPRDFESEEEMLQAFEQTRKDAWY